MEVVHINSLELVQQRIEESMSSSVFGRGGKTGLAGTRATDRRANGGEIRSTGTRATKDRRVNCGCAPCQDVDAGTGETDRMTEGSEIGTKGCSAGTDSAPERTPRVKEGASRRASANRSSTCQCLRKCKRASRSWKNLAT